MDGHSNDNAILCIIIIITAIYGCYLLDKICCNYCVEEKIMDMNRWYVIVRLVGDKHSNVWVCDKDSAKAIFDEHKNRSDVDYAMYGQAVESYNRESYAEELVFEKGISPEHIKSGDWPKE